MQTKTTTLTPPRVTTHLSECPTCLGEGDLHGYRCPHCDGTGQVVTIHDGGEGVSPYHLSVDEWERLEAYIATKRPTPPAPATESLPF